MQFFRNVPSGLFVSAQSIMKLLMTARPGKEATGVMIPIPQYPLYTATLAEYNAHVVSPTPKH